MQLEGRIKKARQPAVPGRLVYRGVMEKWRRIRTLPVVRWISREELEELKQWFAVYVRSFCSGERLQQRNFLLKEEHTLRVCEEIKAIGQEIGCDEEELILAEAVALLHDIGRFEQFARYSTFVDMHSENHAELGLKIIAREKLLSGSEEEVQQIVSESIRHHNRAALPQQGHAEWHLYARLLRDADKLDIWRVVTEYYQRAQQERNEAIELNLPDTPEISEQVLQDLKRRSIVQVQHLRTLNDFKLLQMGWVFDINFTPTCHRIVQRGYLEKIRRVLPAESRIDEVYALMREHVRSRIAQASGRLPAI